MSALVTALELADLLARGEVRVLDVQYNLRGTPGPELYAAAHVPGAPHLDLDTALAGPPGVRGRHPLPDPDVLEAALRACGVGDDDEVVVYDQATSLARAGPGGCCGGPRIPRCGCSTAASTPGGGPACR